MDGSYSTIWLGVESWSFVFRVLGLKFGVRDLGFGVEVLKPSGHTGVGFRKQGTGMLARIERDKNAHRV